MTRTSSRLMTQFSCYEFTFLLIHDNRSQSRPRSSRFEPEFTSSRTWRTASRVLFQLQVGLENWFKHKHCRHLHPTRPVRSPHDFLISASVFATPRVLNNPPVAAVPNCWDAQRSSSSVGYRNPDPPNGLRFTSLIPEFFQPIFCAIVERLAVHTWLAAIGIALSVCKLKNVTGINFVVLECSSRSSSCEHAFAPSGLPVLN